VDYSGLNKLILYSGKISNTLGFGKKHNKCRSLIKSTFVKKKKRKTNKKEIYFKHLEVWKEAIYVCEWT
jgi:hypothetical protein